MLKWSSKSWIRKQVTYLTAIPAKISSLKLRNVVLESNVEYFAIDKTFDIAKIINKEIFLNEYGHILDAMFGIANATIFHPKVQELIMDDKENFDAIIAEWMFNDLYSAFSAVFGCPLIWSSSVNAHPMLLSVIDEAPNPAYTADLIQSASVPPFSFVERVEQLWILLRMKYLQWKLSSRDELSYELAFSTAVSKRGKSLPSYKAVQYNGSIVLANAHVATGEAMRLPMNHINIGGYHINESSIIPLPQELQSAMDNSKDGVIYFSMGTVLKSRGLPDSIKNGLIKIFSELKYTVIWKFEDKLSDLPKNLYVVDWAPQQSILAHPKCVLFITHGGLLSTTEAIHFGVPIIGIPMFADQYLNIKRAEAKGFGKKVAMNYNTPVVLKTAIEEVLSTPR
ncbi:UDP-glycosyltransferase UGT5-like [Leptidea sinapis]|uniref:UDP-glycosyltransferase UGT5-like n=1 Tax=Leptidea sinapis TaxID=189913 RepID=UPI0021C411F5|nr:UDP-glycosyltransferase UGT5-like [Leptidea sinapis]